MTDVKVKVAGPVLDRGATYQYGTSVTVQIIRKTSGTAGRHQESVMLIAEVVVLVRRQEHN